MGNKVTYNDVVIEDGGRTNIYAKEPTMYYDNQTEITPYKKEELYNGRWAMIGIVSGIISYAITGNLA